MTNKEILTRTLIVLRNVSSGMAFVLAAFAVGSAAGWGIISALALLGGFICRLFGFKLYGGDFANLLLGGIAVVAGLLFGIASHKIGSLMWARKGTATGSGGYATADGSNVNAVSSVAVGFNSEAERTRPMSAKNDEKPSDLETLDTIFLPADAVGTMPDVLREQMHRAFPEFLPGNSNQHAPSSALEEEKTK